MFKLLLSCFQKYDWGCTVYLVPDYEIVILFKLFILCNCREKGLDLDQSPLHKIINGVRLSVWASFTDLHMFLSLVSNKWIISVMVSAVGQPYQTIAQTRSSGCVQYIAELLVNVLLVVARSRFFYRDDYFKCRRCLEGKLFLLLVGV